MSNNYYKNLSSMLKSQSSLSESKVSSLSESKNNVDVNVIEIKDIKSKTITTDVIDDVSAFLDITTEYNGLTPQNMILVVTQMMSIVAKYKQLSGNDKKKIVLTLIKNKILELDVEDGVKKIMLIMADEVVPDTIDVLVDISKGRYKFKYIPKVIKYMKKLCCSC